jgi:hypothetical protein
MTLLGFIGFVVICWFLIPKIADALVDPRERTGYPQQSLWHRFWHGKPVVTDEMREKHPSLYSNDELPKTRIGGDTCIG